MSRGISAAGSIAWEHMGMHVISVCWYQPFQRQFNILFHTGKAFIYHNRRSRVHGYDKNNSCCDSAASAYAGLTRAQAAKLFFNLFEAKHGKGETLLFNYNVGKDEVYLTAVDGGRGTMTAGGTAYDMAHPVVSTSLIGSKGKVVLNGTGEALTFLPITGSNGVSNAAVIIGSNGSAAGLDSLAGGASYSIYKNGSLAKVKDLKQYDVATYASATNSIIVSDTRVTTYYESCKPSPSSPATITVLGGKELNVLPTAVESLSKLKPGKQIVLLLTADGQVAGAEDADKGNIRGNAIAVVSDQGDVQLVCGGALLSIGKSSDHAGQAVAVSSDKGGLKFSKPSVGTGGVLLPMDGTLGGRKLADNAMIFDGGKQTALSGLSQSGVSADRISYARINWAGEVDLVVLNSGLAGDMIFGRIKSVVESSAPETPRKIVIENGNSKTETINGNYDAKIGDFVAVSKGPNELGVYMFSTLERLANISSSSWVNSTAVNNGNRTYEVPSNVQCYNADTGTWFDSLDAARDYGGTMNLYIYGGVVRIVEVKG